MPKIEKIIPLDLSEIPEARREIVKERISEYVQDKMFELIGDGKSPVKGETFKKLSKEYADKEKGGDRTPNLELFGDMLDATHVEPHKKGIRVFVDADESDKADGHNQLTAKAQAWAKQKKFPKRRFIPDKDQEFKDSITRGVNGIIQEYATGQEGIGITIDDILSTENILDLLNNEF